eukprot:11911051-Prorocentrum_lima.AAC.1
MAEQAIWQIAEQDSERGSATPKKACMRLEKKAWKNALACSPNRKVSKRNLVPDSVGDGTGLGSAAPAAVDEEEED